MSTKQVTVEKDVHAALKAEARKRRMTLQGFLDLCLRGALKLRGVEIGDPR